MSDRSELPIGAQEVARLFRLIGCEGCQVNDGDVTWYFRGGLVVRMGDAGFWLSVSPARLPVPDPAPA